MFCGKISISKLIIMFVVRYPWDSNSVFVLTRTFWPHYHYLIPNDYKSGEYGTYGKNYYKSVFDHKYYLISKLNPNLCSYYIENE